MNWDDQLQTPSVLHWNYKGFTEFPLKQLKDEEKDVTDIYLKENLIAKIPSDIDRLTKLESLYLTGNDIAEIPIEISRLKCLKCLDLSGNRLRRIPEEIGDVKSLKFLILDDNQISELPLRLIELRVLRYLSVCDNKLKWLPQRPVYNYYHCELRFWRNTELKTVPYSLWYHMLRDQQTRSLNIGCLRIPQTQHYSDTGRCRLKLENDSRTWNVDVESPYQVVQDREITSPQSLLEICRRKFYQMISDTARELSDDNFSIYSDNNFVSHGYNLTEIRVDQNNNDAADQNNNVMRDNNGIETHFENLEITPSTNTWGANEATDKNQSRSLKMRTKKNYFVPSDVIEEYFDFLPKFLNEELTRGPISRCENVKCKRPIFDFVNYEFCIGKIVLIDNIEDIILSAAFCSQYCANVWKGGKTNLIIPWTLKR